MEWVSVIEKYSQVSLSPRDLRINLTKEGIPTEISYRLDEHLKKLIEVTVKVGDRVLSIGKAIVGAIWKFVKENPGVSLGLIIGLACGSFVGMFVGWIPFVGDILNAIVILISGLFGSSFMSKFDDILKRFLQYVEDLIKAIGKAKEYSITA